MSQSDIALPQQLAVPQWRQRLILPVALWVVSFVPLAYLFSTPILLWFTLFLTAIPALLTVSFTPLVTSIAAAYVTMRHVKNRTVEEFSETKEAPHNSPQVYVAATIERLSIALQLFIAFS